MAPIIARGLGIPAQHFRWALPLGASIVLAMAAMLGVGVASSTSHARTDRMAAAYVQTSTPCRCRCRPPATLMRRLAAFVFLIVAVAAGAYGVTYYFNSNRQPEDQWTWLQREFALTSAQLTRIQALQKAYQPVCAGHCSRIMAAKSRLTALAQAGRNTPEYLATLDQWEAIKHECNAATFKHLEAVNAVTGSGRGPPLSRHDGAAHRHARPSRADGSALTRRAGPSSRPMTAPR